MPDLSSPNRVRSKSWKPLGTAGRRAVIKASSRRRPPPQSGYTGRCTVSRLTGPAETVRCPSAGLRSNCGRCLGSDALRADGQATRLGFGQALSVQQPYPELRP